MQEIKPPNPLPPKSKIKQIFLAGSIEMGSASNWQEKVLKSLENKRVIVLNPRRDHWDNSWEQSINNPKFKEQVLWELNGLEQSDIIVVYFDPATKSPVSLLELGLFSKHKKIIVACPHGFWRKGNIDIVCEKFKIPLFESLEDLILNLNSII